MTKTNAAVTTTTKHFTDEATATAYWNKMSDTYPVKNELEYNKDRTFTVVTVHAK